MREIPRAGHLDSTLALLREGYPFIQNRCRRLQSDVFQTRLMGMTTICLHGQAAAEVFYDPERFIRAGALPRRVQNTLMGRRGVQTLDFEPHRHRKAMFMSLMTPDGLREMTALTSAHWRAAIPKWEQMDRVVLFDEAADLLCRAACAWTGVPLAEQEVRQRAQDLVAMIEAPAAVGPRHWRGKRARRRAERWAGVVIEQIRNHELKVAEGAPAHVIAWHRELDGELLETQVAAVELLNLLRPIVAIAVYIAFLALALHKYPQYARKVKADKDDEVDHFVHEVRRFYPFFPCTGARVREDFEWRGYRFPKGTPVLLDIYGTNRDPRLWERPEMFWPERFNRRQDNPFDFIPQGGGSHATGHRCAGE